MKTEKSIVERLRIECSEKDLSRLLPWAENNRYALKHSGPVVGRDYRAVPDRFIVVLEREGARELSEDVV